jgi:hypothetical protein
MKKIFKNAPKFTVLQDFAVIVQNGTMTDIHYALQALRNNPLFQSKGWKAQFNNLAHVMASGLPHYAIFAQGNGKLPFWAFSTLPAVTCPGAGACISWCYSFSAWRYPAAFCRQVQNAYFMRFHPEQIMDCFAQLSGDVRLYVDGDFSSLQDVDFWMECIRANEQTRVYGYSKSFAALLAYPDIFPANYLLNISGGHNSNAETIERVKQLPITRGEFIAVSIGRKVKGNEHGTAAVNAAIRKAFTGKVFPCPGTCGTCTGKGHACGLPQLKGITIAIAIH